MICSPTSQRMLQSRVSDGRLPCAEGHLPCERPNHLRAIARLKVRQATARIINDTEHRGAVPPAEAPDLVFPPISLDQQDIGLWAVGRRHVTHEECAKLTHAYILCRNR